MRHSLSHVSLHYLFSRPNTCGSFCYCLRDVVSRGTVRGLCLSVSSGSSTSFPHFCSRYQVRSHQSHPKIEEDERRLRSCSACGDSRNPEADRRGGNPPAPTLLLSVPQLTLQGHELTKLTAIKHFFPAGLSFHIHSILSCFLFSQIILFCASILFIFFKEVEI